MKQAVLMVLAFLLLAVPSYAGPVVTCPPDGPFDTGGKCQGTIGPLAGQTGETVTVLLPAPDCFPTAAGGIRLSLGPGLNDPAPEGAFAAFNGATVGQFTLYVRNDNAIATPALWLGLTWQCIHTAQQPPFNVNCALSAPWRDPSCP